MKLSVLPPREPALRVSGQACPHAESIILSAGGAETMMLSARGHAHVLTLRALLRAGGTDSIILSVGGVESMMLSARAESIILSVGGAESMMLSPAESMMLSA